jgi:hypothetical protein
MGQKENAEIKKIMLESPPNMRLFRANSGMAWTGKIINKTKDTITIKNPRPFHGLPSGTPDLIGWESLNLCEFIDQKISEAEEDSSVVSVDCNLNCEKCVLNIPVAIFIAKEIKTCGTETTKDQHNFIEKLNKDGGQGEIIRID